MVIRGYNECHNILTITFLFNLTTSYWYTTYHKYSDNAYNATKHTTRTYSFLNFEIVYLGNKLVSQMNYCYNKSKCWLAVIGLNQVILWFKIFFMWLFPNYFQLWLDVEERLYAHAGITDACELFDTGKVTFAIHLWVIKKQNNFHDFPSHINTWKFFFSGALDGPHSSSIDGKVLAKGKQNQVNTWYLMLLF